MGMTQAAIAAAGPTEGGKVTPPVTALIECYQAYGSLDGGDLDAFLALRAPHVVLLGGTMRCTLLTAVTDREALIRQVTGDTARRPHHQLEPPALDMHLIEAHHDEE